MCMENNECAARNQHCLLIIKQMNILIQNSSYYGLRTPLSVPTAQLATPENTITYHNAF